MGLATEPLVQVAAADLLRPAQELRAAVLRELEFSERHLATSRSSLRMASALDPRWRSLFWCTAQEKEAIAAELKAQGIALSDGLLPVAPPMAQDRPGLQRLRKMKDPGLQSFVDAASHYQAGGPAGGDGDDAVMAPPLEEVIGGAVDLWLSRPAYPADSDPLSHWEGIAASANSPFRCLVPLARKYLCAPGASGTVERLWASGRRVLTFSRHSLSGGRFNQLLRLKSNLRKFREWPPQPLST